MKRLLLPMMLLSAVSYAQTTATPEQAWRHFFNLAQHGGSKWLAATFHQCAKQPWNRSLTNAEVADILGAVSDFDTAQTLAHRSQQLTGDAVVRSAASEMPASAQTLLTHYVTNVIQPATTAYSCYMGDTCTTYTASSVFPKAAGAPAYYQAQASMTSTFYYHELGPNVIVKDPHGVTYSGTGTLTVESGYEDINVPVTDTGNDFTDIGVFTITVNWDAWCLRALHAFIAAPLRMWEDTVSIGTTYFKDLDPHYTGICYYQETNCIAGTRATCTNGLADVYPPCPLGVKVQFLIINSVKCFPVGIAFPDSTAHGGICN